MERFTFRTVGGTAVLYLGNSSEWAIISGRNNHEYKISGDAAERLAAYEDTGLEPEEIKVREAAKYNAGYYHGDEDRCRWIEKELGPIDHLRDLLQAERAGRLVMLPCKVGDTLFDTYFGDIREKEVVSVGFMLSKSVKHMTIHANNFRGAITEIEMDRIGKDIFYTREAAEAALKGGEG